MQLNLGGLEKLKPGKVIRWFLWGVFSAILVVSLGFIFSGLPSPEEIKNYQIQSTVPTFENFNWDKKHDGPIRLWLPLRAISENLKNAVVISEDDTFYRHKGINFEMAKEAFKVNWERKRYARGFSTITMQVARNAFLSKEKTLLRKIREIIIARRMEKVLPKHRILELYLNMVEWGENIYGAEAASQYYFGKSAGSLNLTEATLLASILPNPKRFNPFTRMRTVKRLQKRVLDLMALSRIIDEPTAMATYEMPIYLRGETHEPPPQDLLTQRILDKLRFSSSVDSRLVDSLAFVTIYQDSIKESLKTPIMSTDSLVENLADSADFQNDR